MDSRLEKQGQRRLSDILRIELSQAYRALEELLRLCKVLSQHRLCVVDRFAATPGATAVNVLGSSAGRGGVA